jgi:hypothetical protein
MTVHNNWYPAGLAAIGAATINLAADTLRLVCINDLYVFNDTHTNVTAIASYEIGSAVAVAGTRSMVGRTLVTDTAVTTIPTVPVDTNEVGGIVLYHATTGTLLHLWQREGDIEIVLVTDGGGVEIEFTEITTLTPLYGIVRI